MMNTIALKYTVKGLIPRVANWTLNPNQKISNAIIKIWRTVTRSVEFVWIPALALECFVL